VPKRSTEFQELVALITSLVGDDGKVEESRELIDLNTGQAREVDIVVEREVAGHNTIVSIECNERGRKQGVPWVEEMKGKHEWLPTNVLVLVAKSGFTKTALEKAARSNIRAITPTEVTPDFIGRIVNNLDKAWLKHLQLDHFERMTVWCEATGHVPKSPPLDIQPNAPLFWDDGNPAFTAVQFATAMARNLPQDTEAVRDATGGEKFIEVGFGDPEAITAPLLMEGKRLCMYVGKGANDSDPELANLVLAPIIAIRIIGKVSLQVVEMTLTHGTYDGSVHYSDSSAQLRGEDVRVVVTETPEGGIPKVVYRTRSRGPKRITVLGNDETDIPDADRQ
jgi:hypothetical protein